MLDGPNAIAISTTDATAPARILSKFAKTAPALEIKGGVVEGTFYDAEGMKAIAAVPSREELLSKLLGSMQSPITNFARVINQIAEQGGAGESVEVLRLKKLLLRKLRQKKKHRQNKPKSKDRNKNKP